MDSDTLTAAHEYTTDWYLVFNECDVQLSTQIDLKVLHRTQWILSSGDGLKGTLSYDQYTWKYYKIWLDSP